MVGPPSERELCLETMIIKVRGLIIEEPCDTVPIGFSSFPRVSYAGERFGTRTVFCFPGVPVRLRLVRHGMKGAKSEVKAETVLCA